MLGAMKPLLVALVSVVVTSAAASVAHAQSGVTDGKFTNVYVFQPDRDGETWDQHVRHTRSNGELFTMGNIDHFTEVVMSPGWPSYFDALAQHSIHPPQFFGSHVASKKCVDAAFKDSNSKSKILSRDAIRSLANCHLDGMDPSPQVNLIFSPDIVLGKNSDEDMCQKTHPAGAYHGSGLNVPNHAVLPTSESCLGRDPHAFETFTKRLTHEDVEVLSDPANMGHGNIGHEAELADQCEHLSGVIWPNNAVTWPKSSAVTWPKDYTVARYWSDVDKGCEPTWPIPDKSTFMIWNLKDGTPAKYFTGKDHDLTVDMPAFRQTTTQKATAVLLAVQTGDDDLRGGNGVDGSADVVLFTTKGQATTAQINHGNNWRNGETHVVALNVPPGTTVEQLKQLKLSTHFLGGLFGDNWKVNRLALIVAYPSGAKLSKPRTATVETWLDASDGPLVRFSGEKHDITLPVPLPSSKGTEIRTLDVLISTGNDDLRGGSGGDNCDITIDLVGDKGSIPIRNANDGEAWPGWSTKLVPVNFKEGLKSGDIKSVTIHTGFGGGMGGDNWNVQRVQVRASLKGSPTDKCPTGRPFDPALDQFRGCDCPAGTKMSIVFPPVRAECK
jgi:hypothetical protein